jgi:hypothetical protein
MPEKALQSATGANFRAPGGSQSLKNVIQAMDGYAAV